MTTEDNMKGKPWRVLLGKVTAGSGQLMVVDPRSLALALETCEPLGDGLAREFLSPKDRRGFAVVFKGELGESAYPVYGVFGGGLLPAGRMVRVEIDLLDAGDPGAGERLQAVEGLVEAARRVDGEDHGCHAGASADYACIDRRRYAGLGVALAVYDKTAPKGAPR